MPEMTAEQAAEWGKTLSFEKVWAVFTEVGKKQAETGAQIKELSKQIKEDRAHLKETERIIKESQAKTDEQLKKTDERQAKTDAQIKRLSKNIGGVNRSLGKWAEQMVGAKLCKKFDALDYVFTKAGANIKLMENGRTIAEIDRFLENGEYVIPVEVKTNLTTEDVDDHLERIKKIRRYMDNHNDSRTIVGAAAGAVVPDDVCKYAQKKGLYVLTQSGDSVAIAEAPEGFSPHKW